MTVTGSMVRGADSFADISGLLEPGSIAVIGASDRPGNLGGVAIRHLLKFGYPGAIWPVHPTQPAVAGLPGFPNVRSLPRPPDLAIFAISAPAVAETVRECAAVGIRHGIVWAGGFAEVGGEGVGLQRHLAEVCGETGFKLCGPNCIGVINAAMPMVASFTSSLLEMDRLLPGAVSVVGQSGGTVVMAHALAYQAGFGLRYVISSGNEAQLTTADYLYALAHDAGTRIIGLYLEGVRDSSKFLLALHEARALGKPVVIIKAGATAASVRAALAHTGALAGEDRVYDAIFREMAAIRVYSLEELIEVSLLLSGVEREKLPAGPNVAVITFGGGAGVLGADQCAQSGLHTPPLDQATTERLQQLLTPLASTGNPIDLTPDSVNNPQWLALLPQALDAIAADPNIHAVLFTPGAMAHRSREVGEAMCGLRTRTCKTVCVSWRVAPKDALERLPARGVFVFPEPAHAARALRQLVRYRANLSRPPRPEGVERPSFAWSAFVRDPAPGTVVSEPECHRILAAAGLPVAAGRLVRSPEEAALAAASLGYPVALKGISSAVTHRAAAGLLALHLASDEAVRAAGAALTDRAKTSGVSLDGLYVQHMVPGGIEILVSAFRDEQFGVMVACGAGGNLTEALDDVTLERAPVNEELALHMLRQLRSMRHLQRWEGAADPRAASEFVARFSKLAATALWRRFVLEVNPLKWNRDGVVAVDGLLLVEQP
jgi:acetyltransferase